MGGVPADSILRPAEIQGISSRSTSERTDPDRKGARTVCPAIRTFPSSTGSPFGRGMMGRYPASGRKIPRQRTAGINAPCVPLEEQVSPGRLHLLSSLSLLSESLPPLYALAAECSMAIHHPGSKIRTVKAPVSHPAISFPGRPGEGRLSLKKRNHRREFSAQKKKRLNIFQWKRGVQGFPNLRLSMKNRSFLGIYPIQKLPKSTWKAEMLAHPNNRVKREGALFGGTGDSAILMNRMGR